jgi:hypothetical protein
MKSVVGKEEEKELLRGRGREGVSKRRIILTENVLNLLPYDFIRARTASAVVVSAPTRRHLCNPQPDAIRLLCRIYV